MANPCRADKNREGEVMDWMHMVLLGGLVLWVATKVIVMIEVILGWEKEEEPD